MYCVSCEVRTEIIYVFADLMLDYWLEVGARGSVVVKALCYKPEGRGFDSR
jgi:hypothetical protein